MSQSTPARADTDLLVIGGGVNGCGIARDAVGRGLSVTLVEKGDLAQATSSSSTKLFHGGLRYLEFFEFKLVRESLIERERLLSAMPHISWPMRFVLPFHRDMRFDSTTPTSRLLTTFMPWMKGRRPAWLIRFGLFLYDNLGGRKILPGTRSLKLKGTPEGAPLDDRFETAFEYSDCWIEDSRLVVLNARDAEARGAQINVRTELVSAEAEDGIWRVTLRDSETGQTRTVTARMLVNAAGPWVADVITGRMRRNTGEKIRLVRGSHLVTRKLYDHDKCYFFQGTDGRIIFAIPYERDFTLIGTTDQEHLDATKRPEITDDERDYLLKFASSYFKQDVTPEDVVWTYSGVRPLYDDGAKSATAATRDYVLSIDEGAGAPALNVFGGKITTYRRLAEGAMEKIGKRLGIEKPAWTSGVPLPGGDFPVDGVEKLVSDLRATHPFLDQVWATRLVRAYGTEAAEMLDGASSADDMGRDFGATLTERELRWMIDREYVRSGEDAIWRRTKLGLRLDAEAAEAVDAFVKENRQPRVKAAAE